MAIPPQQHSGSNENTASNENNGNTAKKNIITKNPFLFYISTSIAFGALVTVLSLWTSPNGFSDFCNSRPQRGEMGFGRFLIRGTRFIDGKRN